MQNFRNTEMQKYAEFRFIFAMRSWESGILFVSFFTKARFVFIVNVHK